MNTAQDIQNINTLLSPYGLVVNEVVKGAQNIKYIINLPLDINIQGKIRRSETNIRYALPSALGTNEFTFGHDKNTLFIERKSDVFQVVDFQNFRSALHSSKLNLVLGIDEDGKRVITNLSKAPHILVGGTTGSGKSELLHAFVASLIEGMPYTDVSLLIIDPKRAEFSPYKNCRNIRVITEMDIALNCLTKAVDIMEERYRELEKAQAKDIYKYNGSMKMYPIVIIIDELADLIQSYPQVETPIVRIAQKARACGIHLIIGTQSPRRDVVTGLIKSNIPTKVALHTSNQVESRIILDKSGAENLLGKGDMLFLSNGSFNPIRIQSAYVDEKTKQKLANSIYCKKQTTNAAEPQKISYDHLINSEPKKVGFFQGIKNLWNAPQTTTTSDMLAMRTSRRSR